MGKQTIILISPNDKSLLVVVYINTERLGVEAETEPCVYVEMVRGVQSNGSLHCEQFSSNYVYCY